MLKRRYLAGKIAPGSPRYAKLEAKYGPLSKKEAPVEAPKASEPVSEVVEEALEEKKPAKPKRKTKKVVKKKSED